MDWWAILLVIFGSLVILMMTGMPVAFCFVLINMVGAFLLMGGSNGLQSLTLSIFSSVTSFTFMPIPLFILMGEVLFVSGSAPKMIETMDKFMGRLPGRLALLAVASGTMFATLTGSSVGSAAMLGSTLVPEMRRRGYKNEMSIGPILGAGGLAVMIPPSSMGVLIAAVGEFSIGKTLIAIIIPGLLSALVYTVYIIVRCWLKPELAAVYEVSKSSISDKLMGLVRYVLPAVIVIFMVIGLMFLGIASPTEAAATGALGTFILAAVYKKLTWEVVKKSLVSSMTITAMIFLIMAVAMSYGEILSFSGASRGLVNFTVSLNMSPILVIVAIMILYLVLGMFIGASAIIMITIPLIMPLIEQLGFDPVWFAVIAMINLETGAITPPFGVVLFVMKGLLPDTSMSEVVKASMPYIYMNLTIIALIMIFPALALWLPRVMR